jgi:starch phosphorylase
MEASGTSGMKAAFNGALNMSTFDGWWCEGYQPEGGWVIGAGEDYDDLDYQDMVESQAMYNLLENEIIPLFYTRSADGLPRAWIKRMKNSIRYITPRFSTYRMVGDYMRKFYVPAGKMWQKLNADEMAQAKHLSQWNAEMKGIWSGMSITNVDVHIAGQNGNGYLKANDPYLKVGSTLEVRTSLKLGRVKPEDICIQLYSGPVDSWGNITNGKPIPMKVDSQNPEQQEYTFTADLPCTQSGHMGMAVRVVPNNENLASTWEPGLILWEGQVN